LNNININNIEEMLTVKEFSRLFSHYLHIYMVFKGHYSKNIPQQKRKIICEQFVKTLRLPSHMVRLLQSEMLSEEQLNMLDLPALRTVKNISEEEILDTFSQLATTV